MQICLYLLILAPAYNAYQSEEAYSDYLSEESHQCPTAEPPFPTHGVSQREETVLFDEVFASSHSNKGVYHIVNTTHHDKYTTVHHEEETLHHEMEVEGNTGHVSILFYPTDLERCQRECAVLQRMDNAGKLLTPQIYVTKSYQLLILFYGYGSGKVVTYDKKIKLYTWQKVTVSLLADGIRLCVSSLFDSHCHKILDDMYEYSVNGPWVIGGTAHKKGMPGFIREVTIVPGTSHLGLKMNEERFVNKALTHFKPGLTLPLAEVFFLCKAHQIADIPLVSRLTDNNFECPNNGYTRESKCYDHLEGVVQHSLVKRVALEAGIIQNQIAHLISCIGQDTASWIQKKLSGQPVGDVSSTLELLGKTLLLSHESSCTALVVLILGSCYGTPDTLFNLAGLLRNGILLPKLPALAQDFTLVAATQGSVTANLALASQASTCPVQFAYHGVVAEKFLTEWKQAASEDLVAERTRLHHGEFALQDGTDDQVFQFLLMQAQQGNADAQANIGRMFYWGQGGVERNIDDAFEMQRAAALQNHPDGLFDAGIMTLKGHGTDKNTTKARHFLEKAAKAGHKGAPGTLGYLELNENNNVTGAVHYFNQSHHLGDTDATHNLAIIQSFYEAFDPNPYYAHEMFKLASERGHKDATMVAAEQTLTGLHNLTGNCHSALKYIKMLSDQSNVVTRMMRLGTQSYQAGRYDEAFLQYLTLAEAGVEIAQYNLAWLCENYGDQITHKMPDCSKKYYAMSAKNGYGPTQAIYANELWKQGNLYDAARWYAKAAENNAAEGLFGLGFFSKDGIAVGVVTVNGSSIYFGPDKNSTKTKDLWNRCFQSGVEEAMLGCGVTLLWYTLTSVSLDSLLLILVPFLIASVILAYILARVTR